MHPRCQSLTPLKAALNTHPPKHDPKAMVQRSLCVQEQELVLFLQGKCQKTPYNDPPKLTHKFMLAVPTYHRPPLFQGVRGTALRWAEVHPVLASSSGQRPQIMVPNITTQGSWFRFRDEASAYLADGEVLYRSCGRCSDWSQTEREYLASVGSHCFPQSSGRLNRSLSDLGFNMLESPERPNHQVTLALKIASSPKPSNPNSPALLSPTSTQTP